VVKRCKVCKAEFVPVRSMQTICGAFECSVAYAGQAKTKKAERVAKKAEREKLRERKEAAETMPQLKKRLEKVFNRWIVLRDKDQPCISCGRLNVAAWHAGHYRSVGSAQHLRFHEDNVHKQCDHCNVFLHGNLINYKNNLTVRIGIAKLESLEQNNTSIHLTRSDIESMIVDYRQRIKGIENDRD
jgi:hypothetical protein